MRLITQAPVFERLRHGLKNRLIANDQPGEKLTSVHTSPLSKKACRSTASPEALGRKGGRRPQKAKDATGEGQTKRNERGRHLRGTVRAQLSCGLCASCQSIILHGTSSLLGCKVMLQQKPCSWKFALTKKGTLSQKRETLHFQAPECLRKVAPPPCLQRLCNCKHPAFAAMKASGKADLHRYSGA